MQQYVSVEMYVITQAVNCKFLQNELNRTLNEHLSSLDVELLWRVSRLSCTLQDGGSRLWGGRAGHCHGLGPLGGFHSRAGQLDSSPLSDRNCVESKCNYHFTARRTVYAPTWHSPNSTSCRGFQQNNRGSSICCYVCNIMAVTECLVLPWWTLKTYNVVQSVN